jgi:rare lipoprotein A
MPTRAQGLLMAVATTASRGPGAAALLFALLAVSGCATLGSGEAVPPRDAVPPRETIPPREVGPPRGADALVGVASWYGPRHHGRPTASGQPFDMNALVAAHRTLPLGSRVRVTNLDNGRTVVVQIVDRGPYVRGRLIDVSQAAAEALDMLDRGTARVRLEVLPPGE